MPNLHFQSHLPDNITESFRRALEGFHPLHSHSIYLKVNNKQPVTMRAQPIINSSFFSRNKRAYKVEIRTRPQFSEGLKMKDLPEDVLVGWFAHEFGHLIDYLNRPWYNLVKLGIAYLTLPVYRMGIERRADLFAIEYGYVDYIQATKKFILEESSIPDRYLNRINKYYMTPEEIERITLDRKRTETDRDTLI